MVRVFCVVAWLAGAIVAGAAETETESEKLQALFAEDWEHQLSQWPGFATVVGDPRYNDRLPDLSAAAWEKRRLHDKALLAKIEEIDASKLPEKDRLDHELFRERAREIVRTNAFPNEYLQLDQMSSLHTSLATLAQGHPRQKAADYDDLVDRLRAAPRYFEEAILLLRQGAKAGITPPRVVLRDVEGLIGNQIADDPTKTPIYQAGFSELPASIPPDEQERIRKTAAEVLKERVMPAFRALQSFFVREYLPRARKTTAWSDLPNGRAWYQSEVKRTTTTDLTPDAIHEIGLAEVARIRAEMEAVRKEAGFEGGLEEFFAHLRSDPRFYFTERDHLLAAYRELGKRIDPELPKLFGTLPRLPYGVHAVPSYAEKTAPTAYYEAGTMEAGRAARVSVNLYDLGARPKWEMEALMAHEAVPGHHLQIALAQEMTGVPRFRQWSFYTAYVEGWGLYAESLGPDIGLYRDAYSKFGRLNFEMWRAIRLVVDTGMHWKGWTREQAIAYFTKNSGKPAHDIEVEVDRYLVWPAQALAYKVGELKIQELRRYAAQELGAGFDVRRFHDRVLGAGALPLSVLERRIKSWVEDEKRAEKDLGS
jgi:uncharacterized protein (DUF885 family)